MKIAKKLLLFALILLYSLLGFSQRGKDASYTSMTANFVLNSATYLTANATANSTSIIVNSNSLTGGFFTGALAQGDLILIIQMQGATMDIDPITSIPLASGGWGGHYTVAASVGTGTDWHLSADIWGRVTNYNQSGKFEQVEVLSVSGTNIINLQCPLKNNYTSAGHVQVIRVPRFQNLTINTGASLVPAAWNGNTGGVVAAEVSGNLVLTGTGKISATGLGFRGGVADNQGGASTGGVSTGLAASGTGIGDTYLGSDQGVNGARKGEGIGGYTTEYAALYSVYGRSGAANGGGGAGYQNAGGGGGSNIGTGTYTGKGNPNPTYASFWNLELAGFGASTSSGGGRGGYTLSTSDQNEAIVGPNNTLWGSGYRKPEGGYGGHTLAYDNTRVFMGGGGGAGDQDNLQGGSGGAGGGIAFLTVYGSISGTGSIESNGADGLKSNPTSSNPGIGSKKGTDGAGGAGAGGSIYIQNSSAIPSTISLSAKGGKGGDNAITLGTGITTCTEANGPGGGGAGGAIAITSGAPSQVVTGGANGIVTVSGVSTSSPIANFPMNGATVGGAGMSGLVTTIYDLIPRNDTICSGNTASLSVNLSGTISSGGIVYWYTQQFGGTSIANGLTFVTPTLTATTTYYVGVCPGNFRVPVIAVVKPKPLISGTAVITNTGCSTLGSISGLAVSGGTSPYFYSWNNVVSSTINLASASIGTYNLLVTDSKGCSDTAGPYSITGTSGPVINSTGVIVTNQSCTGVNGSITGITATGNGLTYNWNNGLSNSLDLLNQTGGNYTLVVTDINNCSVSSPIFTINSSGSLVLNSTSANVIDEHCSQSDGSISGIVVSGGTNPISYTWTNTSQTVLDLIGISSGVYTLTAIDALGCVATSSQFVINNIAGPSINEVNALVLNESCALNDASITGITSSGGIALWSNNGGANLNAIGLSAGTYILTVTDAFGCFETSNAYVVNGIVPMQLDLTNFSKLDADCDQNNGSISGLKIIGGINPQVLWSNNATTLDISLLAPANYQFIVTDNQGCSIDSSILIATKTPPIIDLTTMVLTEAHCGNSNGSISGIQVIGGTPDYTFKWNNNLSSNSIDLINKPPGVYNLLVTDNAGCTDSKQIIITEIGGPIIDINSTNVTQISCSNLGSITNVNVNGSGPFIYQWSNNISTIDNLNLSEGSYSLLVTDAFGCQSTSPIFTLTKTDKPTADFYWNNYMPNVGSELQFYNNSTNAISYEWNFGDGSNSNQIEPNHIYTDEQVKQYNVYLVATSISGCVDTAFYTIIMNDEVIYYIPNSFTPNSDQFNNVFQPIFTQGIDTYDFYLFIYNRWGEIIFESKDPSKGWDGTYNGVVQQDGLYTWEISFKMSQSDERKMIRGHVNLLR